MSGHSHAKTIKHKKDIADAKKGKIFSKLGRLISIATKEKGGDPTTNAVLRMAIEKARSVNMPKDNVERAIKRGIGGLEGATLEGFLHEAYGPGGTALMIEGVTDNKNRTLSEIKHILDVHGGKFAQGGNVQWLFERKGTIAISMADDQLPTTKEDLELKAIDAGAEDVSWHDDILEVYTKIDDLEAVKKKLEAQNLIIESASLDWVPKNPVEIKEEKIKEELNRLFEALDENDDVQEIYSNLK